MPARENPQGNPANAGNQVGVQKPQVNTQPHVHVKAPVMNERKETFVQEKKEHASHPTQEVNARHAPQPEVGSRSMDRVKFYAGKERIDLQGNHVQRVRELQEENDHLQREIIAKEGEIAETATIESSKMS